MMDKEKWKEVGLQIADHMKAIRKIAEENDMKQLGISIFSNELSWATYIDENETIWGADLNEDGRVDIRVDQKKYHECK